MDRLETADILAVLKAAYPQFYNGLSPKGRQTRSSISGLKCSRDEPVMVVAVAVKAMIASRTNTFPRTSAKSKSKSRRCVCRRK